MKTFWNDRYGKVPYAYGKAPNAFLKEALHTYPIKGKVLFPAEGEGRNAVYAASIGLDVHCFDYSIAGRQKALALADERKVHIQYDVYAFEDANYPPESFDAVVFIFAHVPPDRKRLYYQQAMEWLKPGGYMICELFSKAHKAFQAMNPQAGGPQNVDMLFSEEEFGELFSAIDAILLEEVETDLNEGTYHQGLASVIRFVGIKRKK